jgi:nicotinamidase-related amidase
VSGHHRITVIRFHLPDVLAFRRKPIHRKRLIIGALHTEICLTFATVQALKDGYDVLYVADAVGGRSQTAHRHRTAGARRRGPHHGARGNHRAVP